MGTRPSDRALASSAPDPDGRRPLRQPPPPCPTAAPGPPRPGRGPRGGRTREGPPAVATGSLRAPGHVPRPQGPPDPARAWTGASSGGRHGAPRRTDGPPAPRTARSTADPPPTPAPLLPRDGGAPAPPSFGSRPPRRRGGRRRAARRAWWSPVSRNVAPAASERDHAQPPRGGVGSARPARRRTGVASLGWREGVAGRGQAVSLPLAPPAESSGPAGAPLAVRAIPSLRLAAVR